MDACVLRPPCARQAECLVCSRGDPRVRSRHTLGAHRRPQAHAHCRWSTRAVAPCRHASAANLCADAMLCAPHDARNACIACGLVPPPALSAPCAVTLRLTSQGVRRTHSHALAVSRHRHRLRASQRYWARFEDQLRAHNADRVVLAAPVIRLLESHHSDGSLQRHTLSFELSLAHH